ncbi:MAG TPA: PqqD family protein [Nitrososphaera sp.]|nr:PqqD family protein [Nitrososphaera sp.]
MHKASERDDDRMLLKRESVNDKLILRRGVVGNDCDGTPLLINGRGEAYRVNDTAVSLWNMCNGITFDDLLLEVLRISSGGENDVRKSLEEMVRKFQKVGVIELRDHHWPHI